MLMWSFLLSYCWHLTAFLSWLSHMCFLVIHLSLCAFTHFYFWFSLPAFLFPGRSKRTLLSQRAVGRPGRLQGNSCPAVCGSELQRCPFQEAARLSETPQCGSNPEPGQADLCPPEPQVESRLGGQQLVLNQSCYLLAGPPGKGDFLEWIFVSVFTPLNTFLISSHDVSGCWDVSPSGAMGGSFKRDLGWCPMQCHTTSNR